MLRSTMFASLVVGCRGVGAGMEEADCVSSSSITDVKYPNASRQLDQDDNSSSLQSAVGLYGISLIKDASPFSCDLAAVVEECISSTVVLTDDDDEDNLGEETVDKSFPSSPLAPIEENSAKKGRKKRRKIRTPSTTKIYSCDWCHRASFKSGQGLRFHKTIRCPLREKQLGKRNLTLRIVN